MRKFLLFLWLLVPVGGYAYHMGPGQRRIAIDDAGVAVAEAKAHAHRADAIALVEGDGAAMEHWALADEAYENALQLLPTDLTHERRALRIERSKVQMNISQLPAANSELKKLVDEMLTDADADAGQLSEARGALASSQYYLTWLMRLEGAAREVWEPEIEVARQTYKLLAEEAQDRGTSSQLARAQEDLESSIRLARMDLTELQGLPIPSQ